MKKLIAVLVIAIVLVGAVFADTAVTTGNEELLIKCTITPVEPTFTLVGAVASSVPANSAALTDPKTGEVVSTVNTVTAAGATITLDTNAIVNGDVTIYCFIKQANDNVKSLTTYKFSVTATALSNSTNGQHTPNPTVSLISAISSSDVTGGRTTSSAVAATGNSSAVPAQTVYSGLDSDSADLASFNVKWDQTDLAPAEYQAYITLIITT